jgi:hypothetical protein
MATESPEATLVVATVSDANRAREAVDTLMSSEPQRDDLDIVLYTSRGQSLVLVAAKSVQAEQWAAGVLREHGATVEEQQLVQELSALRNRLAHGVAGAQDVSRGPGWAAVLLVAALERGLVRPREVLALLVTSGASTDRPTTSGSDLTGGISADERRRRLAEADAELEEVSKRLEATLRTEWPELFDRRGRLRRKVLAQRLAERTGGKTWLSGDDLVALEEAADAEVARSARAP